MLDTRVKLRCHSFQHLQNALAYAKMLPATCSNIRKPHLHMPTCYTFQHPQTALAHADMLHVPAFANRMFRVQGLGGEKDKDMVNVGVRRQTRSPPNIAMLSSIPRGSSQAKPQPPQHCNFVVGSVWEFAGQSRSPPYSASFCKGSAGKAAATPMLSWFCFCPITSCSRGN